MNPPGVPHNVNPPAMSQAEREAIRRAAAVLRAREVAEPRTSTLNLDDGVDKRLTHTTYDSSMKANQKRLDNNDAKYKRNHERILREVRWQSQGKEALMFLVEDKSFYKILHPVIARLERINDLQSTIKVLEKKNKKLTETNQKLTKFATIVKVSTKNLHENQVISTLNRLLFQHLG